MERIVPSEVSALTGRPTYGGWVVLGTEEPSDRRHRCGRGDDPAGRQRPAGRWPISHTVYAVQWFIFGAHRGRSGWVILLRRDVQTDGTVPLDHEPATHDV